MNAVRLLDAAYKLDCTIRTLRTRGDTRKIVYLSIYRDVLRAAARGDLEGGAVGNDPPHLLRHKARS